jgi:hypothetical protein
MWVNKMVDINNTISLDSKPTLGAHNIDNVSGNVTLRFTNGTERFVPLGQTEPIQVSPHEYSYIDDSNEVLCRLEIRQVQKTLVDETACNVFYIVQGNEATLTNYCSRQHSKSSTLPQNIAVERAKSSSPKSYKSKIPNLRDFKCRTNGISQLRKLSYLCTRELI